MANITKKDLIEALKESPKYKKEWELDVDANLALSINFDMGKNTTESTKEFEIIDGYELIVKFDKNGKVISIEIV